MSKINLKKIPKSPGVYQFFDSTGKIIYIGKSVMLANRVQSYFNGKTKLNFAKQKMVKQIADIKTIITQNETESLILETNLIKTHKPKYNILMKDDKNYLYIKISNEKYPKISKTRIKTKNGNYFGPYISGFYVNNILKFIKKFFGCGCYGEHFFLDGKRGYNLDKYIFKNNADKILFKESEIETEYNHQIKQIIQFLKGDFKELIGELEEKMKQHAQNLEFEDAQKIKLQIESIQSLEINQNMRDSVSGSYHIVHYLEKYEKFFIGLTELKNSKIVGYYNYEIETKLGENTQEILTDFIERKYCQDLENNEKIKFLLPETLGFDISEIDIEVPKIGAKKDLLSLTYKNIYEFAQKKHIDSLSTKGFTKKNMMDLLKILGYQSINKDILFECNDISHLSGTHTVASRSIIENGKSNTSKYKKFNIKTLKEGKIDDFDSMREVMQRRLKEIDKTNYIPDLIIIDGGKGQLSSVVEMIEKSDISENLKKQIQLVSIAKKEEELFLPYSSDPIIIEKESNKLRMIQKIRDEAHRFAISFNRDKRIKSMKKNILESLPGFGPVTRKKILTRFGNIEKLGEYSETELLQVMNIAQLETLRDHGIIH